MFAVDEVQTMNHLMLNMYLALIVALAVLAILPIRRRPASGGSQS
jgi:hypothetical protein